MNSVGQHVKHKCGQCSNELNSKRYLSQHVNNVHLGKGFSCNTCEYKATSTLSLKFHVDALHKGIKVSCKECTHQAFDKSSLFKHVKKIFIEILNLTIVSCVVLKHQPNQT